METLSWVLILLSLCISALLKALFFPSSKNKQQLGRGGLPPGPSYLWSNLVLLSKSFSELEPILRDLRAKYGPMVTLTFGSRPAIFVATNSLAHQLLIQNGAVSSDRPRSPVSISQLNISSSSYGPTWRLFRRNLASEILHPSRVQSFSWARLWVLDTLIQRLSLVQSQSNSNSNSVRLVDHFQYAMFSLLVLMCFGDRLDENQINEIARVQRQLLVAAGQGRFNVLSFWPRLGKTLFRNRWNQLIRLRSEQDQVLIPLIKARIQKLKLQQEDAEEDDRLVPTAYVDTLVNLQLPEEENRKLTHDEMLSMCSEFLNAGTDTTTTALQWIMANLVKYPRIQDKLYKEITAVVGPRSGGDKGGVVIKEEDLEKMPYLRAVVLEGLRRHPPGHFVLPHRVTEQVELDGYLLPKGATVNFMVAEMGWDPKVWDDPMEFKPERFLFTKDEEQDIINGGVGATAAAFDITGNKEIKMMPFGAGRRICPGSALSLLHLEYFIANLIWYFQWTVADGDDVDLSEKQEFTVVMKNPLRAHISPRSTHIISQ